MSPVAAAGPPHTRVTSVGGGGPVSTMNGLKPNGMDGSKVAARLLPHLDDLTSVTPDVDINTPIRRILQEAESLAKQADSHLDFRRPDLALQEFIKASTIAMEIIPRHKDYLSLSAGSGELNRTYMGLLKRIKAQQGRFEEAKRIIKEDNDKSGVRPRSVTSGAEKGGGHPQSKNGTSVASNGHSTNGTNIGSFPNIPTSGKKKPPIQPKPDALHGKALQSQSITSSTSDLSDLAGRFARLRSAASNAPLQDPRIRTQPITIPEQSGYITKSPTTSQLATFPTTVRPLGPREMPSVPSTTPRSPRPPLDTQVPGMPKPPDAIYSPSRNPDTAATINFPTSIQRSSSYIGNGNNAAPPVSSAVRTPSFDGRRDVFTAAHKMSDNGTTRPDPNLPNSTTVSVNDLTKYLRMGSQILRILLVDVRSREEFDDGHIMSPSIVCIEPVTLRDGISSDELVESLVLSPDSEQKLFEQRHEFDLVVFYDQQSFSMKGSGEQINEASYLQNFSKAMYEYGYDKQLKRRPMLLLGGLNAWTDLMGLSSLQSSSTGSSSSKKANGGGVKSARPLGRVPMAREAYRFTPGRKRTYESRPLSKEDESKWNETLKEHPTTESPTTVAQDGFDGLSYARTTEDFFRRYPELPSIQESMISAQPAPKRVAYQNSTTGSIPGPPARPAPALPRQRSSGVLEKTPVTTYSMTSGIGSVSAKLPPTAGLTGLANSGVTCYANATVQCLSATGPLRDYLLNFETSSVTKVPRKAGETSEPPQLLARNLGNLLGHMWSGQYDYVVPNTFLLYVNAIHMAVLPRKSPKNQAFGGTGRQHDASEFLLYLTVVLHDELDAKRDTPDYYQLITADIIRRHPNYTSMTPQKQGNFYDGEPTSKLNVQVAIRQEWERLLTTEDSIISRVFHGHKAIISRCTNCGFALKRFSAFPSIQLNFPGNYVSGAESAPIPLMDLFRSHYNIDSRNKSMLDILEDYECKECETKNSTWQDNAITYMPDYFVVQVQRFEGATVQRFDGEAKDWVGDKLAAQVTFKEVMEFSSIFIPGDPPPGGIELARGQKAPFIYDCYGVVMHHGTSLQGGHYTCMTRNLDKPGHPSYQWHRINDRDVQPCDFNFCQRPKTTVTDIFMKRRLQA